VAEVDVSQNSLQKFVGGNVIIRKVAERLHLHGKIASIKFSADKKKLLVRFDWCGRYLDDDLERIALKGYLANCGPFRVFSCTDNGVIQFYRDDRLTVTLYPPGHIKGDFEQMLRTPKSD
jgi:hypothetical protein